MQYYPAPAKINLFLHIVGRRADGYHLLESVFTLIDFFDEIGLSVNDSGRITRVNDVPGVPEDRDLTVRAARMLQEKTGTSKGVSIDVRKNIPMGAGLGGGSSDAATVLMACRRLWNVTVSDAELHAIAQTLGADVPYFLVGRPAFVTGIGEHISPIPMTDFWVALALPPVFVSTAEIFSSKHLTRSTVSEKIAAFTTPRGKNDLEPIAAARYPIIADTLNALRVFSENARMSGSGAACFALFDNKNAAEQAVKKLPNGVTGQVFQTLRRHPLI
jgi:4-diphosphocytidyl-2-C-methyl-D-erythritol kinase